MAGAAEARWDAARRLYEGEAADPALLAALGGLKARSIRARALKDGWRARRGRHPVRDRLQPLIDRLTRQAALLGAADDGGPLPAGDLAAITALLKTIQILGDMTGGAEERAERTKENDDRLAATLKRIDERIVELAKAHAVELLRQGWRDEGQG